MVYGDEFDATTQEVAATVNSQVKSNSGMRKIISDIEDYTEGHMVVSIWSWSLEDVEPGESAGVCMRPANDSKGYASCWSWTMNQFGSFGDVADSYLVDTSSELNAKSLLENMNGRIQGVTVVPAMFGEWVCAEPYEVRNRWIAACGRLLPKVYTTFDPSYQADEEVTLVTYLTSRGTGRIVEPAAVSGNASFFQENRGFASYNINLRDSISLVWENASAYGPTMLGLATAVASLAF